MRIARLLPKKTNKLSECVVLVTRVKDNRIYSTTNVIASGYECSLKIISRGDIDLSTSDQFGHGPGM